MSVIENIWAEMGGPVRRFIGSRVRDSSTADDLTQDVMLKVQTQLKALPPEEKLAPWVFRIARNAVIDHYRRPGRQTVDLVSAEIAVDVSEPEQERVVAEISRCLRRMVDQLPEPFREALKLADFEGLSQQEIADRAGLSLSGAKSRVQRAREQLRLLLLDLL